MSHDPDTSAIARLARMHPYAVAFTAMSGPERPGASGRPGGRDRRRAPGRRRWALGAFLVRLSR